MNEYSYLAMNSCEICPLIRAGVSPVSRRAVTHTHDLCLASSKKRVPSSK